MADLPDDNTHAKRVDRWLAKAAKDLPRERQVALFERAVAALWQRAHMTLGEVTLCAVTERVLHHAAAKYSFLAQLKVERDGVRRFDVLAQSLAGVDDGTLNQSLRFVVIEILSVLGNLTDEIVTPGLHAELAKVSARERGEARGKRRGSKGDQGRGVVT